METKELTEAEKKEIWNKSVTTRFENSAKKLLSDLQEGKSVFMPTEKQLANAKENTPITKEPLLVRKAIDGKAIVGINQIIAQQTLHDAGYRKEDRNYDVLTFDQAKKCGAYIKQDEKGEYPKKIDLLMMKDENSPAYYTVYSAAATKNPQTLPILPNRRKYSLQEFKTENGNIDEYLGKYIAATSQGGKFITTPKIAEEFKTNLERELSNNIEKGNFKEIVSIGAKANNVAKNTLGKLYDRGMSKNNEVKQEKAPMQQKKSQDMSMSM